MSELNDPRVLFAAERTLMAWTRTAIALMAFGFVVERFGLFEFWLHDQGAAAATPTVTQATGIAFVLLGVAVSLLSVVQYRRVLRQLRPPEFPRGYWVSLAVAVNLLVALAGLLLGAHLVGVL
jgi:putative membrane protein